MHDWYQMPALILTILLLPAFGHLYLRTRDIRNLLWFLAFLCVVVRMVLLYSTGNWEFLSDSTPWSAALGQASALLAAALFLGSLSPLSFRVGRIRVLYAIPYILPLIAYAIVSHLLYHHARPGAVMFWVLPALVFTSIVVGVLWDQAKGSLPTWVGTIICIAAGAAALWFYFHAGLYWPLIVAESATYLISALLVLSVFRRVSPGVLLTFLGFVAWGTPALLLWQRFQQPEANLLLLRLIVMAKVATALGLILLALENELAVNKAAGERELRARRELQAYTDLILSRRRLEDFDRQADQVCQAIAANSRFAQAALLLLQPTGMYRLAGSAGLEPDVVHALHALAARIVPSEFLIPGSAPLALENSLALQLDLRPWMLPGDDLEQLGFTSALAVPLRGDSAPEGVLLLAGMRHLSDREPLRRDDLAALETLAARVQSVRSQTRMLERLIDSEKFAGLGQLAGNVTQQLNDPLTVVLGYASLLQDSATLEAHDRLSVEAILGAARSMRNTLESLQRVARTPNGYLTAVSVAELLTDMEHLHRAEFVQRDIEFRVDIQPDLPRVLCDPHQLRQAVLHCLQFAMDSVEMAQPASRRCVELHAKVSDPHIRIIVTHTGPAFAHPERAFDPFVPAQAAAGETIGLGLSLCASIVRENNGQVSATNLHPVGAAITMELEAA